jgi:hypothetical protein
LGGKLIAPPRHLDQAPQQLASFAGALSHRDLDVIRPARDDMFLTHFVGDGDIG